MEDIELNLEELFFEIREAAEAQGALTKGEWDDLIDEALEERRERGELHDDDDWESIREALRNRYEEFEEAVPEM
jgi:hypothetical protein